MIQIHDIQLRRADLETRMPFRYGIATMTALPHVFVVMDAEIDGKLQRGVSADHLPPKWFTKDPERDPAEEIDDMLNVIGHASKIAGKSRGSSFYDWWRELDAQQAAWGEDSGYPALLYRFGTALVERALLDALCRHHQRPFHELLHANVLGLRLGDLHPELGDTEPATLLPSEPLREVFCRHTVGLADPLRENAIRPEERIADGLPQSLEACISTSGLTHFKIKVTADRAFSLPRLREVLAVIDEHCAGDYRFSLDGNESFTSVDDFRDLWEELSADPVISKALQHLLFIEQPLHRNNSLQADTAGALQNWADKPPLIIDESDADLSALPTALAAGYLGISHKNCKGAVKGIANACLLEHRRRESGAPLIMSGEDLANIGPVAVMQDLAVQGSLGNASVERNGHHYFTGLSMWPAHVAQSVQTAHPDLYEAKNGFAQLAIRKGNLSLASVNQAPFGVTPLFDSLGEIIAPPSADS